MDINRPDSDRMDVIANQFVNEIERQTLPKLVSNIMTLKEQRDLAAGHESELSTLRDSLQQEAAFFFDLSSADGAAEQMAAIVKVEEQRLAEAECQLRSAQEQKATTKKEMDRVVREIDRLTNESRQLDLKEEEWQDLQRKEKDRVVGHMMRTKFKLDRDSRCVSLHLGNDRHVENVILVPEKENSSHQTNTHFWDKLCKNYKL
jgi:hypothetical protein